MPRSVLVVDDDARFRGLLARTLRSWGHTVAGEAGTLAEALARAAELRPDAVLVDVGLPDGSGITLAEQLAALEWRPLVVLVSSDPEAADDAVARDAGAAGFVAKENLPGVLRDLLAG